MYFSRLCLIVLSINVVQSCKFHRNRFSKSGLTFVIDDSTSSSIKIENVKNTVTKIFDTVLKSTDIKKFTLVTSNDRYSIVRRDTQIQRKFKKALAAVHTHRRSVCRKDSMRGTKIAVLKSMSNSHVFVFTDASADYKWFEYIKTHALKKQIKVIFILPGKCGDANYYQVYYQMAQMTSGMVFNMMNDNVIDILKYVEETFTDKACNKKLEPYHVPYKIINNYYSISGARSFSAINNTSIKTPNKLYIYVPHNQTMRNKWLNLARRDPSSVYLNSPIYFCEDHFDYNVKTCAGPTHIIATGDRPMIGEVTGADRSKPKINHIIKKDKVAISRFTCERPGVYIVQIWNTEKVDWIMPSTEFRKPETPNTTTFVEEGQLLNLKCGLPHETTDLVLWYKYDLIIAEGDLILPRASLNDSDLYTCRVGNYIRAQSLTTKIEVGFKPKFIYDVDKTYNKFTPDVIIEIDCSVDGIPEPKITWMHNGKVINDETVMTLYASEIGMYSCEVSNKFGTIQRSFNITGKDCILDVTVNNTEKMPLIVSKNLTAFNITHRYIIIPRMDYFFMACPSKFSNIHGNFAKTVCAGGTKVKILHKIYELADIKCNEEVNPQIKITGTNCLPGNTEYIDVGYMISNQFLKAYEVCFDKDKHETLFTKHKMAPHPSVTYSESKWFSSDLLPINFDMMYDCNNQVGDIISTIGELPKHKSPCFTKRQLVNAQDLHPGLPPTASFYSLNVIPQWNRKNWDDVEIRIRKLVKEAGRDMIIFTGVEVIDPLYPTINLRNGIGGYQRAPHYLWKVVQDQETSSSLAIIQVNVPDLSSADTSNYVLCRDICHLTGWMENTNWKNVEDGFTFCCTISTFDDTFKKNFSPGMNYILFGKDVI